MTVIALCSAHGAPGVTTSALALTWAWPTARPGRRVLLVDADPAGSGLLTGFLAGGVPDSAGLSVIAAGRQPVMADQLIGCSVALDEAATRMILPGISDPVQARPLVSLWSSLLGAARDLSDRGVDVVIDAGRLGHRYEARALVVEADLTAVVVRGDVSSVAPAAAGLRTLDQERSGRLMPVAMVVDPAGYSPVEIGDALARSAVLSLVRDEWAARSFELGATGGRRFDRAPLLRAARAAVEQIGVLSPDRQAVDR